MKIKIKNLAQIRAAFWKSPRLITKNLNQAIKRVAIQINRDSRRFTPVDTGRLRASHYERFANLKAIIGTNTEYDFFVHEGTGFMKARPYLKNAIEVNEGFIDAEFEYAVEKTLDEIARSAK